MSSEKSSKERLEELETLGKWLSKNQAIILERQNKLAREYIGLKKDVYKVVDAIDRLIALATEGKKAKDKEQPSYIG